jgi:hypothetical protein
MRRLLVKVDFHIHLTDQQVEVLRALSAASGDTIDEYLHSEIIQGMQSDIDSFFGESQAIKEKLYKQLEE